MGVNLRKYVLLNVLIIDLTCKIYYTIMSINKAVKFICRNSSQNGFVAFIIIYFQIIGIRFFTKRNIYIAYCKTVYTYRTLKKERAKNSRVLFNYFGEIKDLLK